MKCLFLPTLILAFLTHHIEGAKILGLFPFPSQSHFNAVQSIFTGLTKNNHNVTAVSSYRLWDKKDNYQEIIIPAFDFWSVVQHELGVKNMFEAGRASSQNMHRALRTAGVALTEHFLVQPKFKSLLSPADKFDYDLIILDVFHTEALLMVGEIYQTPTVVISSSNFESYMTSLVDYNVPSACSPIDFEAYTPDMSFFERISNIFECGERRNQRKQDLLAQDKVASKHFSSPNGKLSPLAQVQAQTAITLLNNYPPLMVPRPTVMNIVPIGGTHIKPTQDIQWNIKRFLDDARDGAIYFSLGTTLKCSDLPKEKMNALLTVLGKQKQKILWHCDKDNIENLPKNILLQKIIVSSDVLAHPHVKYFITTGGLLSLQEAIYRNIPILGIPVFHDQHLNVKTVENLGIGINLDFSNLTETSLTWAMDRLLNEPTFLENARAVSSKFRDRPMGALQTSLFWIEHVLRHKTAGHLRTPGTDLPWYQLHLLDLIILLAVVNVCVFLVGYAVYRVGGILSKRRAEEKLYTKIR